MPPFLNSFRRILPLPEEEMFRTPDFNPQQGGRPQLLKRPPLPQPGQLPPSSPTLTPAISRPALPEPTTGPVPLAQPTAPPMAMPNAARPNLTEPALTDYRGNRISDMEDFQRDQFIRRGGETDTSGKFKVKRSGKDIALNALLGGLQGLASGNLGAGLGGAIGGGLGAAINPQGAREARFGAFEAPRIQSAMAKQQAQIKAEREMGMEDLRRRQIEAQIADEEARAAQRKALAGRSPVVRPEDPRRNFLNTPRGTLDLSTRRIMEGTEPLPRVISPTQQLTEAETERAAQEGDVEQISEDSYQGRGGDAYVMSRLPAQIQEILSKGTVDGDSATPQEIAAARQVYRQAIADEKKGIQDYTQGQAKGRVSQRIVGKKLGSASPTRSAGAKGTVGPRILKGVAAKLKVDENEAARQLEADGYTVRRQ